MINENFVILGAIIGFIGGLSYLVSTIKGKTRPNRATWFLWALASLIAFSAEIKQGVGFPLYILIVCLILFILIRFKVGKLLHAAS